MWKMKAFKKVLLPMAFTVALSAFVGVGAHAATSPEFAQALYEKLPVATYATPLSGASKVYAIRGESGYIDTFVDVAVITDVTSDGTEVYVTYPVSGGYKSRWFKTEDIVGVSFVSVDKYNYNLSNRLDTYRMNGKDSTVTSGYIDKNDACVSLGSHEIDGANYYATIYPVSSKTVNGVHNIKNNLRLTKDMTNNMTDVTRSFAGKSIVLKSVENGKYMSVQKNTNNAPVFCSANGADRRTGGTSWELFNVSVNSSGWAGLKASCNEKWFCARMDVTDNPVYANTNGFSTWEMLRFYKRGSDYYIKSYANNRWLTARVNVDNAPVAAYGDKADTWERFQVEVISSSDSWQMPMKDAYHTWGSGDSWAKSKTLYSSGNSGGRNYHIGIDLMSKSDSNVYAASGGTVAKAGYNSGNGYYVVISHTISGKTVYSFYGHLKSYCVSEGQSVSTGSKIGVVGASGSSSNGFTHLHFAIADTLKEGSYWGYATYFTGNKTTYSGITYYNPSYVIQNGYLPS